MLCTHFGNVYAFCYECCACRLVECCERTLVSMLCMHIDNYECCTVLLSKRATFLVLNVFIAGVNSKGCAWTLIAPILLYFSFAGSDFDTR